MRTVKETDLQKHKQTCVRHYYTCNKAKNLYSNQVMRNEKLFFYSAAPIHFKIEKKCVQSYNH